MNNFLLINIITKILLSSKINQCRSETSSEIPACAGRLRRFAPQDDEKKSHSEWNEESLANARIVSDKLRDPSQVLRMTDNKLLVVNC